MPRPIYIICHQMGTEDRETGLISLFFFIEKMQVTQLAIPPGAPVVIVPQQPFRVIATWMRNPHESPDQEYEWEMALNFPPGGPIPTFRLGAGRFKFEPNRPLHRFTVTVQGPLPLGPPGLLEAESKVRRVGDIDWQSQSYPIVIEPYQPPPGAIPPGQPPA